MTILRLLVNSPALQRQLSNSWTFPDHHVNSKMVTKLNSLITMQKSVCLLTSLCRAVLTSSDRNFVTEMFASLWSRAQPAMAQASSGVTLVLCRNDNGHRWTNLQSNNNNNSSSIDYSNNNSQFVTQPAMAQASSGVTLVLCRNDNGHRWTNLQSNNNNNNNINYNNNNWQSVSVLITAIITVNLSSHSHQWHRLEEV